VVVTIINKEQKCLTLTVFEVKVVDVYSLQFIHHDELVDTAELEDEVTAEQWLDS